MRIDEVVGCLLARNLAAKCVREAKYFGLLGAELKARNSDLEKRSQKSAASGHVDAQLQILIN